MSSEQLMLFAADSLASHTVLPGSEKARQMTVTSGRNIAALLPLSGPLGLLVKMCLESEQLSSTKCYLTWSVSNTPGQRLVFRLAPSMPRTDGNESLFWHTPNVPNGGRVNPLEMSATGKLPDGRKRQVGLEHQVRMVERRLWPPPTQSDGTGGPGNSGRDGGDNLRTAVGGSLNPEWVELLMGFPPGWTDLN